MDEARFIDADNYRGTGQELSIQYLVMEQLQRILKLGSVELRGGMTVTVPTGPTTSARVYLPASDEAYINAVDTLENLVYPFLDDEDRKVWLGFREAAKLRRSHAKHRAGARWEELYNTNMTPVAEAKFRWLNTVLNRLSYLAGAELRERA